MVQDPQPPPGDPPPVASFTGAPLPQIASHEGLAELDPWQPPEPPSRRGGGLIGLPAISETLEVIALAILMFLAVRAVGQNFVVDGSSMFPSFEDGQLLIVNRLAYRTFDVSWIPGVDEDAWRPFGEPQPGDVVVFEFSNDPTGERDFIKRVIAVPGQTVQVANGTVLIDGVPVEEPYIAEAPRYDVGPTLVLPGMVWVLGDNRNNSFDSHSWGMLEQSKIIGRADIVYWPLSDFGTVDHHDPEPVAEGLTLSPSIQN
jgi:signal peptidase I